ncbi:hypothetical protein [Saccharopolyspora sp. NPDC002686]|uniref:hypothetical protein n=1 Tax=Saccharopolyspora sp. NPDC002686 TaxID=3154541 RepID=UPI00331F0EBB
MSTEEGVRQLEQQWASAEARGQRGAYRGNTVDGEFRSTHIAVRRGDRWLLAGIQLSPIGAPPAFAQNTSQPAGE